MCTLGVGAGVGMLVTQGPQPPAGDPLPVDLGPLPPGRMRVLEWRGRSVLILRRSEADLAALSGRDSELADPDSAHSLQPTACRNRTRSLRPDIFVAMAQCTHQGCTPQLRAAGDTPGELLCPCHTSKFDLAGRVFQNGPAPTNLIIPEYRLVGDDRIIVGES
jgi:ubiquinol-cytochrome c reductase iron-sulfur subunit